MPEEVRFQTKPQIALDQIRQALEQEVQPGVVPADAAYGNDSVFRAELRKLKLEYVVGIQSTSSVWKPGETPLPPQKYKGQGRPPKLLRRGKQQPLAVRELALGLAAKAWKKLSRRQGVKREPASRFAALRVRPAHRDFERHEAHPEQWLLIEWPSGEAEPAKYWLSNLPPATKLKELVAPAKQLWIIERDYQELKQELGLNQYEGRGRRGFHHHGTLCIAAYGFLVGERSRFSPSARAGRLRIPLPARTAPFRPRGSPDRHNRQSIATLRHQISHHLANGPSGIIGNRSPLCATRFPTTCRTNSTPAFFVAHLFCNIVVVAARGESVLRRKLGTAIRFSFVEPLCFQHRRTAKIGGCTLFPNSRTFTTGC